MKSMRWYKAAIIFFIGFILQTVFLWRITVFGASPNLLLCLTSVFAFLYDERYGIVLGLISGLALDLSTGLYVGANALGFVAVCVPIFFLRSIFDKERLTADMLMTLIATPIGLLGVWLVYHAAGNAGSLGETLLSLPGLIVSHMVITTLLHLLLVRSVIRHRRDRKYERRVA
ncbi:MAG: rod shape-determining protein MreD [Clostridiales Family XIII bacterium]|jgi:rod shape-determining protein MreD|nr:rod shape-determining protein MreD [Clostridiales Family XIII bacterium]